MRILNSLLVGAFLLSFSAYSQTDNRGSKMAFSIPDLHSLEHEKTIYNELVDLPGLSTIRVDKISHTVLLISETHELDEKSIKIKLNQLNFHPCCFIQNEVHDNLQLPYLAACHEQSQKTATKKIFSVDLADELTASDISILKQGFDNTNYISANAFDQTNKKFTVTTDKDFDYAGFKTLIHAYGVSFRINHISEIYE